MSSSPRRWSSGNNDASLAARICSRDQVLADGQLWRPAGLEGLVTVFSPMRLNEDAVDLFEVDDAGQVTDGFDERAQTQVAGAA